STAAVPGRTSCSQTPVLRDYPAPQPRREPSENSPAPIAPGYSRTARSLAWPDTATSPPPRQSSPCTALHPSRETIPTAKDCSSQSDPCPQSRYFPPPTAPGS